MKTFLAVLIFACCSISAMAQYDTLFWFAAPDCVNESSVFLRFSTSSEASVVTVTQPANTAFVPQVINIPAYSSQGIEFTDLTQIETMPANTTVNKGLKVTCTKPVFAYYEVPQGSDIFALKGDNSTGTEFYIPMQNLEGNFLGSIQAYSSFCIVATEDNTNIQITPSKSVVGHAAGVQYSIILNEGQTYSARASGFTAADHLDGSHVISDKPIAITVADDNVAGSPIFGSDGADLCGDQIVPVTNIGTEYIPINGTLLGNYSEHDQIFMVGTVDNTSVSINGTNVATINTGQTYRYSMGTAGSAYIQTSEPVYALQLSGFGYELGIALLPSIRCTGSSSISLNRSSTSDLFITLLVDSGGVDDFLFNGAPGVITASDFASVSGTNNAWKFARKQLSLAQVPNGSTFTISNTTHVFHEGIINGDAVLYCKFGYFSDFGTSSYIIASSDVILCEGDTLNLSANTIDGALYTWTQNGNVIATGQQIVQIVNVSTNDGGQYIISGNSPSCEIASDTVMVVVNTNPILSIDNVSICAGDTASLLVQGIDGGTVLWDYENSTDNPLLVAPESGATTYTAIGTDSDGCVDTTSATVQVENIPEVTLSTMPVCLGEKATVVASGANNYLWSIGATGNPLVFIIESPQTISVTGYSALNCFDTASIFLNPMICVLDIPNVITPNGDNVNDCFRIGGIELFEQSKLTIFNRWGKVVYSSEEYVNDWDGGNCSAGTYYYIVEVKNTVNEMSFNGTLTILK
jgi:gliding motility-associated-like protein